MPIHSAEGIVKIYEQPSQTLIIDAEKIYNRIEQALPAMPPELCKIMASFLQIVWVPDKYIENSGYIMRDGYLCVTYIKYPSASAADTDNYIAAGTSGNEIHIWNTAANSTKYIKKLTGHNHSIGAIGYNNTTGMLASGSYDSSVRLWPQCSPHNAYKLKATGYITTLAFVNNTTLATGGYMGSPLQIWDLETQQSIDTYGIFPDDVTTLDDNHFVSICNGSRRMNYVRIHKANGRLSQKFTLQRSKTCRKVMAITEHLIAFTAYNKGVTVIDLRKTRPEGESCFLEIPHSSAVTLLAMCGKQYFISSARDEATIKLWNIQDIIHSDQSKSKTPYHTLSFPSRKGIDLAANIEGNSLTVAATGAPGFMQTWSAAYTE